MTDQQHAHVLAEEAELDKVRRLIPAHADNIEQATRQRTQAVHTARRLARRAYELGMPESHIAAAFRVNRRTVRRWLGKPE